MWVTMLRPPPQSLFDQAFLLGRKEKFYTQLQMKRTFKWAPGEYCFRSCFGLNTLAGPLCNDFFVLISILAWTFGRWAKRLNLCVCRIGNDAEKSFLLKQFLNFAFAFFSSSLALSVCVAWEVLFSSSCGKNSSLARNERRWLKNCFGVCLLNGIT